MAAAPRFVTPLPPLALAAYRLAVGDIAAVVTKGVAAGLAIDQWGAVVPGLPRELDAIGRALPAQLAQINPASRVIVLDAGGAAHYSAAYFALVAAAPVTMADVLAGRTLLVRNLAGHASRPSSERFIAESSPAGPRWAGPILPSGQPGENNAPPVARAGADATLTVGETFRRSGAGSTDSDGRIAGYEWSEGDRILSTSEVLSVGLPVAGVRTFALVVVDDVGARSAPDTVTVTVEAPVVTPPASVPERPLLPPRVITSNTATVTRSYIWARRPVFLASGDRLLVQRATRETKYASVYDVIDLDGRVVRPNVRTEREAMPAFTDARYTYGVRDFAGGGRHLIRADWATGAFDILYEPGGMLYVGDGQGRQSNDDRYIVLRVERRNLLVTFDLQRGIVVGSMAVPANYNWASITPDGRYVLVSASNLTRYNRDLRGARPLVAETFEGDSVLGADGVTHFVQGGPVPRSINVETGAVTNINVGNGIGVSGTVSGCSLVPGYVCVAWRTTNNVHEIATMDLAHGRDMWTRRARWASLSLAAEDRAYAIPAAVCSPNGRRIVHRYDPTPNAGDFNLRLLER